MGNMLCSVTNKRLALETIEPKAVEEEVIVIKFVEEVNSNNYFVNFI